MKPTPGNYIRITKNVWENLAAGSYCACYLLKGCIAKLLSWDEYCDYLRTHEENTDFDDLKRYMERSERHFNALLLTDAPQGIKEEKDADFNIKGRKGAVVLLAENDFKVINPKHLPDI